MKIYWSAFISLCLLILTGCGGEQFGTTPQSQPIKPNPVTAFQQASCSNHTLIKPEVDILYVVDNSTSSYYLASDIKTAIQNTIGSISSQFDYRVIGTPLLNTTYGNDDYQVLAKTPSTLPAITNSKKVNSASEFTFFSNPVPGGEEPGLEKVRSFITSHQSDGLFRQGAYLFVVLVSNGRDTDIETLMPGGSGETSQNTAVYNSRKASLLNLKNYFQSQQFRLFSLVTHPGCSKSGWRPSPKSYIQMSKDLYNQPPYPSDQGTKQYPDSYDLCQGSISGVFSSVNSAIQQIIIPHTYKYWPITFTDSNTGLDLNSIKVFKSSPTSAPVQLNSGWSYIANPSQSPYNTRVLPTVGEPTNAKHIIQFAAGSEITYPDCIQVTSNSNLEYFGYVVIPKVPKTESVVLKINGQTIAQSSSNGWSYIGQQTRNIKVNHNGYLDTPAAIRSGYMFQLNGSGNYYKSGDNVEIYYVPATN